MGSHGHQRYINIITLMLHTLGCNTHQALKTSQAISDYEQCVALMIRYHKEPGYSVLHNRLEINPTMGY